MSSKQNAFTILAAIAAVVIPYLLTQGDVAVPAIVKVILTAGNLALVVISRMSNPNAEPVQVQVAGPVAIAPADAASSTDGTPLPIDAEPQG